ncbi:MAG: hemerythrin domain-containing protein, partial [Sneathiella sp.]
MSAIQTNGEEVIFHPIANDRLACPLGYLKAEHGRQRAICRYFKDADVFARMCEGEGLEDVKRLYVFLTDQLPLHVKDEQDGLFPLLARHANEDEKEVREAIRFLRREQEFDKDLIDFILADLKTLLKGRKLVNSLRLELNLDTLLEGLCRHSKWE